MAFEDSRILIVEHSFSVMSTISEILTGEKIAHEAQSNAPAALRTAGAKPFSLYLINAQLPGEYDGYELCRRLRLITEAPIVIFSTRNKGLDKVIAYELGADDYLALPFSKQELVSRVRTLLRRSSRAPAAEPLVNHRGITAGGITLDEDAHIAQCRNATIVLTPREFELLAFLMRNAGNVVSREDLLREAWGWEYLTSTKTVDTHIKRLRDKVRDAGVDPMVIETVRGYGYRFSV